MNLATGPEVDSLRREIAITRAELGNTVEALAAKADVRRRAGEAVDRTRDRIRERPGPWIAAAAAVVAAVVAVVALRARKG